MKKREKVLTRDEAIIEWKKCAKSFEYFAENYIQIIHTTKGPVDFVLYEYQKRVVKNFEKHRFNIVSKFRQGGLTTVACLWCLWKCMFTTKNNRIMFVSKSDREAIGVGKIVDFAVERMPEWLQPKFVVNNKHDKEFEDTGGALWFYNVNAARSKSLSFLVVDEAAYIRDMEEHWAGLFPTLSNGGQCAVISTVKGIGDWYEQMYSDSLKGKTPFNVIQLDYTEHPEYCKPEWAAETKAALGPKRFAREVLRQFQQSSETFIDTATITALKQRLQGRMKPQKILPQWDCQKGDGDAEHGALWVWKTPVQGRDYILCGDTGNGGGGNLDYSAFHVIDTYDMEQVAEFYSNTIPTYNYAQILSKVGTSYNHALMVLERNSNITTLDILEKQLMYENLYIKKRGGKYTTGFYTDRASRQVICEQLQIALSVDKIKINSIRVLTEMDTWIYHPIKKRPEPTKGKHDDLIISLAIGIHICTDVFSDHHHASSFKVSDPEMQETQVLIPDAAAMAKRQLDEIFGKTEPPKKEMLLPAVSDPYGTGFVKEREKFGRYGFDEMIKEIDDRYNALGLKPGEVPPVKYVST